MYSFLSVFPRDLHHTFHFTAQLSNKSFPNVTKNPATSVNCVFIGHDGGPKVCSGCNDVLNSSGTKLMSQTRFCNEACQKADWLVHKPVCKAHQARKMLYRAGRTAQLAFYKYREESWDQPSIDRVDGSGRDLVFCETSDDGQEGGLRPFQHHLFKNEDDKQAVLTYSGCTDAVHYMYWLLHPMLKGLSLPDNPKAPRIRTLPGIKLRYFS